MLSTRQVTTLPSHLAGCMQAANFALILWCTVHCVPYCEKDISREEECAGPFGTLTRGEFRHEICSAVYISSSWCILRFLGESIAHHKVAWSGGAREPMRFLTLVRACSSSMFLSQSSLELNLLPLGC